MATTHAQNRWRDKNRFAKRQLNVMARKLVHDELADLADAEQLRGKGEAVTYAVLLAKTLLQFAEDDPQAARLMEAFRTAYSRDRDMYAP